MIVLAASSENTPKFEHCWNSKLVSQGSFLATGISYCLGDRPFLMSLKGWKERENSSLVDKQSSTTLTQRAASCSDGPLGSSHTCLSKSMSHCVSTAWALSVTFLIISHDPLAVTFRKEHNTLSTVMYLYAFLNEIMNCQQSFTSYATQFFFSFVDFLVCQYL